MGDEREGYCEIKGTVVQIGKNTKSGGRFVTVTTGENLVSIFYGVDDLKKLPMLMKVAVIPLNINNGFVGVG